MHAPPGILVGLSLIALALAAPPPAQHHGQSLESKCSSASTSSQPEPTPTTEPWRKWCEPGQLCDCSRIKDKNGDEYFQCVTNPDCERCWMNAPWTTETTAITPSTATPSPPRTTDFGTMPPGTYTVSASHTVSVIIVPGPEPTGSTAPAASTLLTVTKQRLVTVVKTTVVTVPVTVADTPTASFSSYAAVATTGRGL